MSFIIGGFQSWLVELEDNRNSGGCNKKKEFIVDYHKINVYGLQYTA